MLERLGHVKRRARVDALQGRQPDELTTATLFDKIPKPKPARRNPAFEQLEAEWLQPWARQYGRAYPAPSMAKLIAQWRRIAVLEPDEAIRQRIVAGFLADPDPFVVDRQHDLGLLFVARRWHTLHGRARRAHVAATRDATRRRVVAAPVTAAPVDADTLETLRDRARRRFGG